MKRFSLFKTIGLFLLFLHFTSCQEDKPLVYELTVDTSHIEFSFETSVYQIALNANYHWEISNCPDWLTVIPASGSGNTRLTINCDANTKTEERKAELKIQCGQETQMLFIRQSAKGILAFTLSDTLVYENPAEIPLPVSHSVDFKLTVSPSCDWLSIFQKEKGQYILTVSLLKQDLYRTAQVILQATDYSLRDTLQITQTTYTHHIRTLLEKFYQETNGSQWGNHTNWLSSLPLQEWYGLELKNNRLIKISLSNNNLSGNLPEILYELSDLKELYLNNNSLQGSLSPSIRKLTNLERLNLSYLPLTGDIPEELWSLPELRFLELGSNSFNPVAIPYKKLKKIKALHFSFFPLLNGLSSEIQELTQLETLELFECHVTGPLPPELFRLKNLKFIQLTYNGINGEIPPEIGNMNQLKILNLADNKLKGNIPPEIGKLTQLETLDLSTNELSGNVPEEIGNLIHLKNFTIRRNYLRGKISKKIQQLPYWDTFDLSFILPQINGFLELE
ncbi:BACON domain-containing carbohydrate-binding protein [uncultured Odoribacter sp.]|uniref:BACON domain-containing protein n=1 Tax=uncultured Odoribacter sp. TaxID=876416 RepID=UPI0026105F8E|nr:BACON domain-containing carbohydrate-binding protein [uncultured Odoribacter sp.]